MGITSQLLGVRARKQSPWLARFAVVADRLVAVHGVPTLGNFRDPVKEVFYILLSAKTTDAQYRKTHGKLWKTFRHLRALADAPVEDIRRCIESGGLAVKRASQIRRTAQTLLAAGGERPAKYLKSLDHRRAFEFLRGLPGMGPKSALCVLMYSLSADAFPVDVNVQRIAARMGAIRAGLKHYHAQRLLASVVPDGRCKDLHIAMVVHGRKVCLPREPKCGSCPLVDLCRRGRKELAAGGTANET